jgi:autotransporter-associated beta strand protein
LTAANTYAGTTTISAGTLQLGNAGATGSLSTSSAIVNNANLTVNRSNAVVQGTDFSGAAITGTGSFTQAGAGTTTLTAANTYTGTTTISAGTLQIDGSTTASFTNVATAGTLTGAGTITGNATLTGGGIINLSNPGNITGTLDVNGGNWNGSGTVAGAVTASSGTFTIGTGANLTATSGVTVASTAKLAGQGTITGAVQFTSGSVHSPGNSPGIQTFASGVDYASGSIFEWDLDGNIDSLTGGVAGTDYDFVNVTGGSLTISSGATAKLLSGGTFNAGSTFWDANRSWNVFAFTGATPTNLFSTDLGSSLVTALSAKGSFSWSTAGSNVVLNYTAVPEPTSLVFGVGLGVAGLIAARRRQKSKATAEPKVG